MMEEKKILLIEVPFYRLYNFNASLNRLPLSLGYLAGIIISKKPDWHVKIYNSDFSPKDYSLNYKYLTGRGFENYINALKEPHSFMWEEIEDTIRKMAPSIVGITVKSQNYASASIVAKIVKSINNKILVVFGGPHPTLIRGEILNNPMIDIGVFGEGEETIIEIINSFEGHQSYSSVKGIVYREKNQIVENPPRELKLDLDTLPFPASVAPKCLIDYEKYPLQAFKNIFAIRGCPFNCAFCGSRYIWSRKVRFRTTENIIAEIRELQKKGINYIHFDDDTWGVKKSFIKELCLTIKEKCPGLRWSCGIHIKLVDDETIALMKSAGCRSIQIGVESGNNEILKLIGKNISVEEAFSAAQIIKKNKIYVQAFFIVGFPQETEKTLEDTITAISRISADVVTYNMFTPYFGTELFDYCKKQGVISDNFDFSLFNHHSPENYFCPNIPKELFKSRIRELEKIVDRNNSRKKLKMYFSREGYLKLKERGIKRTVRKLIDIASNGRL